MIERKLDDVLDDYSSKDYLIEKIEKNKLAYHYTGIQGLKGILESKGLFASESKFLNDFKEVTYIRQIIKEVCCEAEEQYEPEFLIKVNEINTEENWLLERTKAFVLSLSEHKDSLILWSNYSKHEGYNLGIDPYILIRIFNVHKSKLVKESIERNGYIDIDHGRVIYEVEKYYQ